MLARLALLVAAGGCYRNETAHPAAPPAKPTPEVRFALADNESDTAATVRILRLAAGKLTVERIFHLPARVDVLEWFGRDPTVWLARDIPWRGRPYDTGHDNEMGVLEPTGYRLLPGIAWPDSPKPTGGWDPTETSYYTMFSTYAGETYVGHCSWYGGPDGGGCAKMTYQRVIPEPAINVETAPDRADVYFQMPKVAPSRSTIVTLAAHVEPGEEPLDEKDETYATRHFLHCLQHGKLIEWPTVDADGKSEPYEIQKQDPIWINSEPPIFQLDLSYYTASGAQEPEPQLAVFEGCERSEHFASAHAGPDDLVALIGDQIAILWHGAMLAHGRHPGSVIAFAPVK